jgi:hypothetical protein
MKINIFCICFLLSIFSHAAVGDRHIEQSGGFSFQAPTEWVFRDFPGMKYQIAFGPATNSFSPNMNVVDEVFDGSLNDYVKENEKAIEKMFDQYKLIKKSDFKTSKGLKGKKMITTSIQQKNVVRQIFYFFPGSHEKYFVVTCSTLAQDGDLLDSVFDESMQSFELLPTNEK